MKTTDKTLADTFTAAQSEIAKYVLARMPHGLREGLIKELESCAAAPVGLPNYLEFRGAGTDVTVYLRDDIDWDRVQDATGAVFYMTKLRFELNWPSHGNADVATSLGRLAFMQVVTTFVAELHAQFGGRTYVRLYKTAEEVAEDKAREAARKAQAAAEKAVLDADRKGLKLGEQRVSVVAGADLVAGDYAVRTGAGKNTLAYAAHVTLLPAMVENSAPLFRLEIRRVEVGA